MRPTEDLLAELKGRQLLDAARAITAHYHLALGEVLSPSRRPPAPVARAALWTELSYLGWSYARTADLFGCDHTTIMAAVRRTESRRTGAGFCARCGGHRLRPGSGEPCPACNGRGVMQVMP